MDKILFVTSNNTGHGHKSITQAIYQQFEKVNPSIDIEEIDAFSLGGTFTETLANLYNKVAVYAPHLWGALYKTGNNFTPLINFFAVRNVKKSFIELVRKSSPDIIVTVHPGFVGSIINILEDAGLNIPVVVIVADLDNISRLWADKRTLYTLCPSKESYKSMLEFGIPEDRLRLFGFPTRDRFNHVNPENIDIPIACTVENRRLSFLIMNGSQGGTCSKQMAEGLLKNFDCNVTILAGRDAKLKKSLEDYLVPKYSDKITVCGFIDNVEYYMMNSDILILRASPNVLTEAINLCKPIIVTGAFTGQEEKNPDYVINNNLGVECNDISMLPQVVSELMADNGRKLNEIRKSQMYFRQPSAANEMAKFIISLLQN